MVGSQLQGVALWIYSVLNLPASEHQHSQILHRICRQQEYWLVHSLFLRLLKGWGCCRTDAKQSHCFRCFHSGSQQHDGWWWWFYYILNPTTSKKLKDEELEMQILINNVVTKGKISEIFPINMDFFFFKVCCLLKLHRLSKDPIRTGNDTKTTRKPVYKAIYLAKLSSIKKQFIQCNSRIKTNRFTEQKRWSSLFSRYYNGSLSSFRDWSDL